MQESWLSIQEKRESRADWRRALFLEILALPRVGYSALRKVICRCDSLDELITISEEAYKNYHKINTETLFMSNNGLRGEHDILSMIGFLLKNRSGLTREGYPARFILPDCCRLMDWFSPDYPRAFRNLRNPPLALSTLGSVLFLSQKPSASIVGTRNPDGQAFCYTASLGRQLAEAGISVISGFAQGIDQAAHGGAVSVSGNSIAVLGAPLTSLVHRSRDNTSAQLIRKLRKTGCFLSEQFWTGNITRERAVQALIMRNRLIAALADSVIVTASHSKGGAMITAKKAFELNKKVYAVDWRDQRYLGNIELILAGAIPICDDPAEAVSEILENYCTAICS